MSSYVRLMSFLQLGTILANGRVMLSYHVNILSDEMINEINQLGTTWKAGRNFDIDTPIENLHLLLGVKRLKNRTRLPFKVHNIDIATEPILIKLEHWPNCPSISLIHNQDECGLCWSAAATEFMSNPICIHLNGTKQVNIPVQHLILCCTACSIGCFNNDIINAWNYYKIDKIVYGSHYNLHQDCHQSNLPECAHTSAVNGTWPSCGNLDSTSTCSNNCETECNVLFNDEKHYASHVYSIENNATSLQFEIISMEHWKTALLFLLIIFTILILPSRAHIKPICMIGLATMRSKMGRKKRHFKLVVRHFMK